MCSTFELFPFFLKSCPWVFELYKWSDTRLLDFYIKKSTVTPSGIRVYENLETVKRDLSIVTAILHYFD